MNTTDKATARPWTSEIFRQHGEYFNSVLIRAHGSDADALYEDNMTVAILTHQRDAEANAALIARAVNEHAALVAVAEAAEEVCGSWDAPHKFNPTKAGAALRYALRGLDLAQLRESGVKS